MARYEKFLRRGLSRKSLPGDSSPRKTSREYRQLVSELNERVKELTLLHSAARLLQGSRPSSQVMLTELAALLPPAWQHPAHCEAHIAYGHIEAATPGWQDTPWKLSCGFATGDGRRGCVEVAYLKPPPEGLDDPFLSEERMLIESVTELVVAYLERCRAEEKVAQLAYFEPVTGLPNRVSLEQRLDSALAAAKEAGHTLGVMLMSLSDFHSINNTLGYRNGDDLLRQVAVSLHTSIHETDVLASLGGGEFVIMLAGSADRRDIDAMIAGIEEALSRPAQVAGVPVKVEGAIGVALYPDHGDTPELLLQRVDVALRAARDGHRNHLLYSPEMDHYEPQRIALLGELPAAIRHDQLTLHYQPKIDLKTGCACGVEALVRWQHPVHGLIYPDRFVLLAERTQLINPLTRWVAEHALRQWQDWEAVGIPLGLSVNLSARNLFDQALCAKLLELALATRLPLERLTLEITESAIMADPARAREVMSELHERGIQFSMDDFGVGQSSLSYLKDLPISRMKIDKSFVIGFGEPRNRAIVRAAIELGHSLGLQITAEGVEDEATFQALRELGCDLGQGYFFSKPLPRATFEQWLRESRWGCISGHSPVR